MKPRRTDSNGRYMRRFLVTLSEEDYGHVLTAITTRIGPLFPKAFNGTKITATGPEDEFRGRALGAICADWLEGIEDEEK